MYRIHPPIHNNRDVQKYIAAGIQKHNILKNLQQVARPYLILEMFPMHKLPFMEHKKGLLKLFFTYNIGPYYCPTSRVYKQIGCITTTYQRCVRKFT